MTDEEKEQIAFVVEMLIKVGVSSLDGNEISKLYDIVSELQYKGE